MDASHPKIRRLRATPVNVPLARPHPTASGVVSSVPLVLMDLETDWPRSSKDVSVCLGHKGSAG